MSDFDDDVPADAGNPESSNDDDGVESATTERRISPEVRAMMKAASASVAAQLKDEDDEYVPADEPAAATVEAPAEASPIAAVAAVDTRQAAAFAAREAALKDNEAKYAEREKALASRETAKALYGKKPGAAIRDIIKEFSGATTDDELRDEISDLISDLSSDVLGIELSSDHKTRIESKRGLRQMKAYQRDIEKEREGLNAKRDEIDQQAREQAATAELARIFAAPEISDKYQFLSAEKNPHEIVWDVVKEQHKRDGLPPDWEAAAAQADKYFKDQFEATRKKYARHLTPPTAPATQVKAVQPPSTPTARKLVAPSSPPPDDDNLTTDERRRRSREFYLKQSSAAQ